MPLTIPVIGDAIGKTVFPDECKGDFSIARRLAERALRSTTADQEMRSDTVQACALVNLLQGEVQQARTMFEEVLATAPTDDTSRKVRAATYASLAGYLQFNWFPGGVGAGGREISARWNSLDYAQAEERRFAGLVGSPVQADALTEFSLVHALWINLLPVRGFLSRFPFLGRTRMERLREVALQPMQYLRESLAQQQGDPEWLAYADCVSADLAWRGGDESEAARLLDRAQATYLQASDWAGAGACELRRGDWLAAPHSSPEVWNFAVQESSTEASDLAWTVEDREFDGSGPDQEQARHAYTRAAELFKQAGAARGVACVELRSAYLAALADDYATAAEVLARARALLDASGDRVLARLAGAQLALANIGLGQLFEGQEVARAIGVWGVHRGSFSYALGLGLFFGRFGRYWLTRRGDAERAIACFRLAETTFRTLGADFNIAQSLVDRGVGHEGLGERTGAAALYESALEVYARIDGERPDPEASVRQCWLLLAAQLCRLYQRRLDSDRMERTAQRMRDVLERTSVPQVDTQAVERALAAYGVDDPDAANDSPLPAGSGLWITLGHVRATVQSAAVLAPLYRALAARRAGDEVAAAHAFEAALDAARRADEGERDWLEAETWRLQKRFPEAIAAFGRYMQADQEGRTLVARGGSLLAHHGGGSARAEMRRRLERREELAVLFYTRVQAYDEARSHLRRLKRMVGSAWAQRDPRPWESLALQAEIAAAEGHKRMAFSAYEQAIRAFEGRREILRQDELRAALAGERSVQDLYLHAARTALELRDRAVQSRHVTRAEVLAEQALAYVERGKARSLLDILSQGPGVSHTSAASTGLRAWRGLNARLNTWYALLARAQDRDVPSAEHVATLQQRIDRDEAALRQSMRSLQRSDPGLWAALGAEGRVMALDALRAALPPSSLLLEYMFVGQDLLAWAVTHTGIARVHRAVLGDASLDRTIRSFHAACAGRAPTKALAGELAVELLEPFRTLLDEASAVIVVPYGAAHRLAFHALPWNGDVLAASHSVSYLPSASVLQFMGGPQNPVASCARSILAVGNPSNMRMSIAVDGGGKEMLFASLPATAAEAAGVANLFEQRTLLLGKDASRARVERRIRTRDVLHFATHGILSSEAPLSSAVLLADGAALAVQDLMELRLRAQLIVFSACETSGVEATAGDDVLGLTRGALAAGAQSALVSLWPVADVSTALLMRTFYRSWRAGQPAAVALQSAQLHVRDLSPDEIVAELGELRTALDQSEASAASAASASALDGARSTIAVSRLATQALLRRGDARPFSHPYFWAPFMFVGKPPQSRTETQLAET